MFSPSGRLRRWAVLLIPAALFALGLLARGAAGRAFAAFTGYRPPFRFAPVPQHPLPALGERVVLVLMDGLGVAVSRGMPFLNELRARGASYECRGGLPSLSMPARAVLMTGAWQEIHGQATNYDARPLAVEHLFRLARAHGRSTGLAAGAKTQTLFAPDVLHAAVYPEEPETAPMDHYEAALRRDLDASIALLGGARPAFAQVELNLADEAGHGWGSASPEYTRAAARVDAALRVLSAQLDLHRDVLVVTADHGHVVTGGHGGPEADVMQVPLVLAGRGVRPGVTGTCAQVDVAPTLAVLMGLPLPAASQGAPLLAALDLTPEQRRVVLRNAVAQREAFVSAYVAQMVARDQAGGALPPGGEDEDALAARLASWSAVEARARAGRLTREAPARWGRAALLAAVPVVFLGALLGAGVFSARELAQAGAFAVAGVAAYHLALPLAGLSYSLTAVNKDEWLSRFFLSDMALGLLTSVVAAAALCAWQRRRGASLLALCGLAWLCAAVFCAAFVLKIAAAYAVTEVVPSWFLPDQTWGMAFYLDALVVMAVGLCAPAFALVAGLMRMIPAAPA
jgi:2,3-bisphosphoglycerate-independent phosphoglycerate mutase